MQLNTDDPSVKPHLMYFTGLLPLGNLEAKVKSRKWFERVKKNNASGPFAFPFSYCSLKTLSDIH